MSVTFTNPQVADFEAYFFRDFPFGTDISTDVTVNDINIAFGLANININPALFSNQGSYNVGYLLLSAHYLVMNLRQSSQGINGQFAWLEQSKGVGAASVSFAIPQRFLDNPYWAIFSKTNYGLQYMEILLPGLAGQMFTTPGSGLVPNAGSGFGGYWQWG